MTEERTPGDTSPDEESTNAAEPNPPLTPQESEDIGAAAPAPPDPEASEG